ncbi:hypothetical protein KRMM14A1259_19510 [Krasilnikovia sp. MM14-A1259]
MKINNRRGRQSLVCPECGEPARVVPTPPVGIGERCPAALVAPRRRAAVPGRRPGRLPSRRPVPGPAGASGRATRPRHR